MSDEVKNEDAVIRHREIVISVDETSDDRQELSVTTPKDMDVARVLGTIDIAKMQILQQLYSTSR